MTKIYKQYREEIESYLNGNISEFRDFVKSLNGLEILELITVWYEMGNITYGKIIVIIDKYLR